MANQVVFETLRGEKFGNQVRVIIQIAGESGEFTPEGEAFRRVLCQELTNGITATAQQSGLTLTVSPEYLHEALRGM